MRRRSIATAILASLASVAFPAKAALAHEAPSLEVWWTGPEDCPATSFTDAMDRLLAASPVDTPIRVVATVEHGPEGWSILTDFEAGRERSGQRRFRAPACSTVSQAAALAIALAVDPTVLDRLAESEPTLPDTPPAEPLEPAPAEVIPDATAPIEPVIPPPEPAPAEPPIGPIEPLAAGDRQGTETRGAWRASLGVAGFIDGGALPGPGGGLAATLGVIRVRSGDRESGSGSDRESGRESNRDRGRESESGRGRFRGELTGSYRFATPKPASLDPRVGGEFSQWTIGVRGCFVPRAGVLELPLCGGIDAGQTRATGTGLRNSRSNVQPWLAGLVAAGLAWPIRSRIAIFARGSLAVPFVRQDFTINGLGLLHRIGPVQGRGLAGLELRLP